jgi:hypothetical protein
MKRDFQFKDADGKTHARAHDRSQRPLCGTKKARNVLPGVTSPPSCDDCRDMLVVVSVMVT